MNDDLLALLTEYTTLRRVSATGGGEYAGPCPFCGGRDRFRAWPHGRHPRYWCRRCGQKGDAIEFLRRYLRLDFEEACRRLGRDPRRNRPPEAPPPAAPVPDPDDQPPPPLWQTWMHAMIAVARERLWAPDGERARDYLQRERGLREETIRAWGLGYNPIERWTCAADWQVPLNDRLLLPGGIWIPCQAEGSLWSVKVRRPPGLEPRYRQLRGGKAALFGADHLPRPGSEQRTVVLTEGEFDAMLLNQEAGDLVVATTMSSAVTGLSPRWRWSLRGAHQILLAYDLDSAGQQGAAALLSISTRTRVIHPLGAKDLTEMYRHGGDLRAWIQRYLL